MGRQTIEEFHAAIRALAAGKGLALNPDEALVRMLVEGLFRNKQRFGYPSCPCCFATGDREKDAEIICPCADSRRALPEHGICRCGLFVTRAYLDGLAAAGPNGSCPKNGESS